MTFKFLDFKTVSKNYESGKYKYLKGEEISDVEQVANEQRKNIVLFLDAVKQVLTNLVSEKKMTDSEAAKIFHGAVFLSQKDIIDNLNRVQTSYLLDNLNETVGINKLNPSQPTEYQLVDSFKALNTFLKLIYKQNDSRFGINPEHVLKAVPNHTLVYLVKKSYEMEHDNQKQVITHYKASPNKSLPSLTKFQASQKSLIEEEPFKKEWDTLKKSINVLIENEQATERYNRPKVTNIRDLKPPRSIQLGLLSNSMVVLENSHFSFSDKCGILKGLAYFVCGEISSSEYKSKSSLHHEDLGSLVHLGLINILDAKNAKPEDIEDLLSTAVKFLQVATTTNRPTENVVYATKHCFADIDKLNLSTYFNIANTMIFHCRVKSLNVCLDLMPKTLQEKPEPKSEKEKNERTLSSYLPSFSIFSSTKKTESIGEQIVKKKEEKEEQVSVASINL